MISTLQFLNSIKQGGHWPLTFYQFWSVLAVWEGFFFGFAMRSSIALMWLSGMVREVVNAVRVEKKI